MTAFYGIFDPSDRSFSYSCAGHPPPLARSGNAVVALSDGTQMSVRLQNAHHSAVPFGPGDRAALSFDQDAAMILVD